MAPVLSRGGTTSRGRSEIIWEEGRTGQTICNLPRARLWMARPGGETINYSYPALSMVNRSPSRSLRLSLSSIKLTFISNSLALPTKLKDFTKCMMIFFSIRFADKINISS